MLNFSAKAAPPEQVHLATNGIPGEMIIQWGTQEDTTLSCSSSSNVEYGTDSGELNQTASGDDDMYLWTTCTHTVILSDLSPNTTYYYRVGGGSEWSDIYTFQTLEEKPETITIGVIADHGTSSNAQETTSNMVNEDLDLVVHGGDISYANNAGAGNGWGDNTVWDEYQNQIEVLASKYPHMYAPGNHEEDDDPYGFDAYESRFYNPGPNSFWYSFDFEFIHFISVSSEHDYDSGSTQYNWLQGDLETANNNRENVPWIVLFGHRPMYSSNGDGDGHGSEIEFRDAMESLLFEYNVDLALWGHDHHYERTYPVFQEEVYSNNSGDMSNPYYSPGATIHIVAGNSGREVYDGLVEPQPEWSAYREVSYGYTKFDATKTSINYKFIRNSDGSIGDEFWLFNTNSADSANEGSNDKMNKSLSSLGLLHAIIGICVVSIIKSKREI
tara:strand:- start:44 stop:1369 length:1326 start_codon:yes stop_codon:yes gene_type:complete